MAATMPRAHDHYDWTPPGIGHIDVTVTRVATNGSWADLACSLGTRTWHTRQPLPLRPSFKRKEAGVIFEERTPLVSVDQAAPAELAASREDYDANACGDCGGLRGQCRCPDGLVRGGERLPVIVLPVRRAK